MAKLRGSAKDKAQKPEEELLEEQDEATEEVVEEPEEKEEELPEVELAPVIQEQKPATQPNVRIRPKQDIRTYIGDSWYSFKAGQVTAVPQQVKEILSRANLLDPL